MPADPSSSSAPRASDADRDRGIELLHAAVADGRFDPAEFERAAGARRYPDNPSARLIAAETLMGTRGPAPGGSC